MKTKSADSIDFVEEIDDESTSLSAQDINRIVLYSNDWTTETILSQLGRENIDLKPRFQRRDAWTRPRKSRLIESLILGLPVPEIVLAEKPEAKGKYIVLDGKQRLLTLLQFTGKGKGVNNAFPLTGLDVRTDLNGKHYADLQADLFASDLDSLSNSTIRAVILRDWTKPALLHMVFHRLNTGSVSLSPQELRQALLPGPFVDFADDKATQSKVLKRLLGIEEPDFRMRDVELLVRYYGFSYFLPRYSGNMRDFLDATCESLNVGWEKNKTEIMRRFKEFEEAVELAELVFGESNVARKWTGEDFESRLNRAVLDVLLFYFSDARIRSAAKRHRHGVLLAFKRLCSKNPQFRESVEFTTKSLTSIHDRLTLWGKALRRSASMRFKVPSWDDKHTRIQFDGF